MSSNIALTMKITTYSILSFPLDALSHVWLFVNLCSVAHQAPLWDFSGKILKRIADFFSRGSAWPRDQTLVSCVSCIAGVKPEFDDTFLYKLDSIYKNQGQASGQMKKW